MRLLDSRRLTGANLLLQGPGAILDIEVSTDDCELLVAAWKRHARRLLDELDWPVDLAERTYEGGVSLALAAPVDGLYTATELAEAAWEAARDWLEGTQRHLLLRAARQLRQEYRDEERPRLQRLLRAARLHDVPIILDDDQVTLGSGCFGQTWDLYELPHPDDVSWGDLRAVPTVLVTGTNGKTTTTRLLASIGRAGNKVVGVSSTDWLAMGDELIDRDDYAGPGGARRILRDSRCELAVLETARGGILRRGLAVDRAAVSLITNVAADHLGDYGVHTVDDLADVKWSVSQALDDAGRLVLNADDPLLMTRMVAVQVPVTLFALSPRNPALKAHLTAGGVGFTVQRGRIVRCQQDLCEAVIPIKRVPVTYDGRATHNVANALAAAAVADALGFSASTIADGLASLRNEDNPGRANIYYVDGATVLLDFAHNPAGLRALLPVIESLPASRRLLITGQAGDRSDEDLCDFATAIEGVEFDRIILKQMDGHARGRAAGEVAEIMRQALLDLGYRAKQLGRAKTELDAVRAALRWARAGDLIVLLSHEQRQRTQDYVAARAGKGTR